MGGWVGGLCGWLGGAGCLCGLCPSTDAHPCPNSHWGSSSSCPAADWLGHWISRSSACSARGGRYPHLRSRLLSAASPSSTTFAQIEGGREERDTSPWMDYPFPLATGRAAASPGAPARQGRQADRPPGPSPSPRSPVQGPRSRRPEPAPGPGSKPGPGSGVAQNHSSPLDSPGSGHANRSTRPRPDDSPSLQDAVRRATAWVGRPARPCGLRLFA